MTTGAVVDDADGDGNDWAIGVDVLAAVVVGFVLLPLLHLETGGCVVLLLVLPFEVLMLPLFVLLFELLAITDGIHCCSSVLAAAAAAADAEPVDVLECEWLSCGCECGCGCVCGW